MNIPLIFMNIACISHEKTVINVPFVFPEYSISCSLNMPCIFHGTMVLNIPFIFHSHFMGKKVINIPLIFMNIPAKYPVISHYPLVI